MGEQVVFDYPKRSVPMTKLDYIEPGRNYIYVAICNVGDEMNYVYTLSGNDDHDRYEWKTIRYFELGEHSPYSLNAIFSSIKDACYYILNKPKFDLYQCIGDYDFCMLMGRLFG